MTTTEKHGESPNILLVDDQPARLLSYEAILGNQGYTLVRASSGTEALQRLMEIEFAAVLLDINMPGLDGFETAALIHDHPRYRDTPIIFVTGVHVTDLDRLKGYEVGAVDYVYVPIIPEILRGKVSVLVELYSKRRELERVNQTLAAANAELACANARLESANAELARANSTLQAEKTRELQRLNRKLAQRNVDLAETNSALEREIQERRRIEAELQESDRRKDEFLATLSHELRNPLAAIGNGVQVMAMKNPEDVTLKWVHGVLARQVSHLTRLIDDLLDVSRITRGRVALRRERVDVLDVVSAAIEMTRPLIESRGHCLSLELPSRPVSVDGDRVRLAQIVGNLLNNAAKYTDEGGSITVSVRNEPAAAGAEPEAVISVRDSGVGIAPEALDQVFELFRQVGGESRADGGLGIGLALSRALVDLHGGTICARSEGPGRGSEFVVRLPAAVEPITGACATAIESAPREAPLRVLVVDDNVDSARTTAMLLELSGWQARAVHNGIDALACAADYHPHVVLMDIGMPEMSGYEVARRFREDPRFKALRIVAMSGYGRDSDLARSTLAGFDAHLVKPLDFAKLEQTLMPPGMTAPPGEPALAVAAAAQTAAVATASAASAASSIRH